MIDDYFDGAHVTTAEQYLKMGNFVEAGEELDRVSAAGRSHSEFGSIRAETDRMATATWKDMATRSGRIMDASPDNVRALQYHRFCLLHYREALRVMKKKEKAVISVSLYPSRNPNWRRLFQAGASIGDELPTIGKPAIGF